MVEDGRACRKGEALSTLFGVKEVKKEHETENRREVRVSRQGVGRNLDVVDAPPIVEEAEGEWKTVREFINLEWEREKHKGRNAGGFWGAASAFSK